MTWFSDIVEGKRKFLSKVHHRFGLKPGVSMETIATILLQKKALLPQKKKLRLWWHLRSFSLTNIWSLTWSSDIVEGKRKFLSKVNHRFGLKPGVSMVTIATILLQKKAILPQKQWGTKELCILRGKSLSYRKHRWMIWVILSPENLYSLRKGYLAAAPLILHTKGKRLASLPNKGMVRF